MEIQENLTSSLICSLLYSKVGQSKPGVILNSVLTGYNRPGQYYRSSHYMLIGDQLKN